MLKNRYLPISLAPSTPLPAGPSPSLRGHPPGRTALTITLSVVGPGPGTVTTRDSHRPVTGQICPLLAADRTSRAPCSGEAGTKRTGRSQHPPVGRRRRQSVVVVAGRAPKSLQAARQNRRRPRAKIVAGRAPKGMPRAKSVQPAAVNLPRPSPQGPRRGRASQTPPWKGMYRWVLWCGNQNKISGVATKTLFQPMSGQAGIPTAGLKFPGNDPTDNALAPAGPSPSR